MDANSSSTAESSSGPSKRRRTDGHDDIAPVIVHSHDLWLSDGTIVLRTVHRVKESNQLTHTLYKAPQAALEAASEQYEGLPVMEMPDNAKDVEDFLKAIYLPEHIHRHGRHSQCGAPIWSDFPGMYIGTLRLAKKYDAPNIRRVIADAIKKEWPTELRYWDERQNMAVEDRRSAAKAKHKRQIVYPEPAHTIRIAMDHDISEVLPVAYYDLFRVYEFNRAKDRYHHAANIRFLTVDELCKLTIGMAALRDYIHNKLRRVVRSDMERDMCSRSDSDSNSNSESSSDSETDDGASPCTRPLVSWWRRQFQSLLRSGDPLGELRRLGEQVMCNDSLAGRLVDAACVNCREHVKGIIQEQREELWKNLPTLFDLRDRVGENWGS